MVRIPRPMGRRAMSALSPLFVRADEAIEIVERVIAGYGTTRISRSGARVRQLFDEADRVRVVVSLDILHVLFQLGEAIADLAAIEIEIGLARAGALLTPTARQRMSA
jgi:hypothetical protein